MTMSLLKRMTKDGVAAATKMRKQSGQKLKVFFRFLSPVYTVCQTLHEMY